LKTTWSCISCEFAKRRRRGSRWRARPYQRGFPVLQNCKDGKQSARANSNEKKNRLSAAWLKFHKVNPSLSLRPARNRCNTVLQRGRARCKKKGFALHAARCCTGGRAKCNGPVTRILQNTPNRRRDREREKVCGKWHDLILHLKIREQRRRQIMGKGRAGREEIKGQRFSRAALPNQSVSRLRKAICQQAERVGKRKMATLRLVGKNIAQ